MIAELTLTERIETLVPLTYMICYAIAYYGPNAEILGSVKLDLWQFKPILDFDKYMTSLFMLFSVDFLSLIMNGIILWTTCNINMFKVFRKIQSEFWLIMAVQQAYSLLEVIKIYDLYLKRNVTEINMFTIFRFLPSSPLEVVQILLLISNGFMVFMPQILRLHQTSSYQNSSTYSCSSFCQ